MSRPSLTIASDDDRVRRLVDARVRIEGCGVSDLTMPVEYRETR
jgi:hypothetical protein